MNNDGVLVKGCDEFSNYMGHVGGLTCAVFGEPDCILADDALRDVAGSKTAC